MTRVERVPSLARHLLGPTLRLDVRWSHRLLLNANGREHWQTRRKRAAALRDEAAEAARDVDVRFAGQATVFVLVHYPPGARRRDVANLMPSIKPMLDGLVDAGVLVDDDDDTIRGPFPIPASTRSGRVGETRFEFVVINGWWVVPGLEL